MGVKMTDICTWCQKEITDIPVVYDSDLDIYLHYECNIKDSQIDDWWQNLEPTVHFYSINA